MFPLIRKLPSDFTHFITVLNCHSSLYSTSFHTLWQQMSDHISLFILYFMNGVKVKVKSTCFNWAPRHGGVLGEWKYSFTHSLTSALDEGEWSASRPCRFIHRVRPPVIHWIGGWMGPRVVLDAVVKRKILSHRRESNPRTPIVQPVLWME
jgi:hypothetical protein